MNLEQQRSRAGDVRRRHRRAVEDGEPRRVRVRQRRREDLSAGCGEVRLQRVPERRRAGGREARDHAAPSGLELERIVADVDRRPAARRGHRRDEVSAVEVRDHPARQPEVERNPVRLALAVVREHDPDRAGRPRLRGLRRERAEPALREHDHAAQRAGGQLADRRREVAAGAAEMPVDRLAVLADDRAGVDERLVRSSPTRRARSCRRRR